jgi:hypothetical protein
MHSSKAAGIVKVLMNVEGVEGFVERTKTGWATEIPLMLQHDQ